MTTDEKRTQQQNKKRSEGSLFLSENQVRDNRCDFVEFRWRQNPNFSEQNTIPLHDHAIYLSRLVAPKITGTRKTKHYFPCLFSI
jgi:hypothetical protein